MRPRLLLLLPTTTYRADAFLEAAGRVDADVTVASEFPSSLEEANPDGLLTLDFENPSGAVTRAVEFADRCPVAAVIGVDDRTATLASQIASRLGLPGNHPPAVGAAGNKAEQRRILAERGGPFSEFWEATVADNARTLAEKVPYPCVIKPVSLSASRGVIRADDARGLVRARTQLEPILREAFPGAPDEELRYLVERYVPGGEFAVEALLVGGALHVLAIFDKPDHLEGPYFAETIYVTPARVEDAVRAAIVEAVTTSVRGLGLTEGPVHAEVRVNDEGAWLIELAARPIGGKCSRVLRFGPAGDVTLEDLVVSHALGKLTRVPSLEPTAAGVMMIPVLRPGRLREVRGVARARGVPGIEEVIITAHQGQRLRPLPEGSRYLGFIFARGESPDGVEGAIRAAFDELTPVLD